MAGSSPVLVILDTPTPAWHIVIVACPAPVPSTGQQPPLAPRQQRPKHSKPFRLSVLDSSQVMSTRFAALRAWIHHLWRRTMRTPVTWQKAFG